MTVFFDVIAFMLAFVIGSLPLGKWLIKALTGKKASSFSAHNLGVENLFHFIGAGVALSSFALDILKGFLAVLLFSGSGWAAVGVYLGHLFPLRLFDNLPRGRGNGVLLGILAGVWAAAIIPWWAAAITISVYAGLLAWTRYVALATLGALLSFVLMSLLLPYSAQVMSLLLFAAALWRHKASIMRIIDRTEPVLGEPAAVLGRDPNVVLAAFMIHPITLDDLWQARSNRWLKTLVQRNLVSEKLLRRILPHLRPQIQADITGIELSDGRELRVLLVGGPMLPDQIRSMPEAATRMAIRGARLARSHGAEAFGLGAFWSTIGNKGLDIQQAVPDIAITNGGAYTAATVKAAVPGLLETFAREGGNLRSSSAAVVGANGVVAFGVARMIAAEVAELILIGRDPGRLERSAETLKRKYKSTRITVSTDVAACTDADLIFTATSDPDPVLFARHVKPGAWIFDLGRPADVDASVQEIPGVHIIPGGVVRPPGSMQTHIDMHFGDGLIPACLAETMIMTATRAYDRKSLGATTKSDNIDFYLQEAERLGFEIVTRDERVARLVEFV